MIKNSFNPDGLTSTEAHRRLKQYGPNSLKPPTKGKGILLFLSQFKSVLILLLIGAAILSFTLGGRTDSIIIFTIVFLSGLLGYFQERGAVNALEKLLQIVESKVSTLRDGKEEKIPIEKLVPGDVVILRIGDLVPADCTLFEATHLFINESTLTGESLPIEKNLTENKEVFLGTIVASGYAKAVVTATGSSTKYNSIVERIRFHPPETAFELGVRKFSYFLLKVTVFLIATILIFNLFFHKPLIESLLFSLAIAVGLTPQLLPAIITVNLSHGARRMAKKHVVIKRLASIENFGQMNVLCADKTGTITEGKIYLDRAVGIDGNKNEKVELYAFLNAKLQSGYTNPLDQAIISKIQADIHSWKKLEELPYDFTRKRLSILCEFQGKKILIVKGAAPQVLPFCTHLELPNGTKEEIQTKKQEIEKYFHGQAKEGYRTLAVAYGETNLEENLTLLGFVHFFDPIKPEIAKVVGDLKEKGIQLKIITGDHRDVALHAMKVLGVSHATLATGEELRNISEHELISLVKKHNVFAEIDPTQKEHLILALRKAKYIVGFLGDGVNDVAALHSADVSITVNNATDAAKEASDIVLLRKDLIVLRDGIQEGRRTFINTLKYIYMATSANFGNMFSMAGASIFMKFLPLLPIQVLLTNFFSDLPEMALASDNVDAEACHHPVKWDLPLIKRFMLVFGILNSIADYLTFGALLFLFHADPIHFRAGWFIENVITAALTVLVIRTRRVLWHSKPSRLLLFSVLAVVFAIPFLHLTPLGKLFDLVSLPWSFYLAIAVITIFYLISIETAKRIFFKSGAYK
jgi:Mg2+-importing ATPase